MEWKKGCRDHAAVLALMEILLSDVHNITLCEFSQ